MKWFRRRTRIYINDHPLDTVKHAFEWFGGVIVVMRSGDAYIVKHDWMAETYQVILVKTIDGRR